MQDKAYAYAQAIEEYTQEGSGPKRLSVTTTFADDLVSQTRYDNAGTPTTRYVQTDGFGSTRLITDENGAVTDTIDYDAFGNVIARAGAMEIEHLYRGQALDPNTGFYYLRARYYDPNTGRFNQMDRWAGRSKEPGTLNKYVYGDSDPINGWDPTGSYTQSFGYAVEEEVERQYRASHAECGVAGKFPCYFGVRQYYDPTRYLKPDVMNWSSRTFLEIKPFSPSGIAKAGVQLAAYTAAYRPFKFDPDTAWTPSPASVQGTPTYFANAGGVIFYTDDRNAAREWAALSIATAASIFRRYATSTVTRLGADAVGRAAINNALRVLATANSGRLTFQASTVVLTRF